MLHWSPLERLVGKLASCFICIYSLYCYTSCICRCCATTMGYNPSKLKVFRYSFFGNKPHFLNRLLDSLLLVRSTWNLPYLLVLDWTLAWFTFCENRYFHDNDKQKSSKIVKLKFCAIQISFWKVNTNILNYGVWHTKYTRTKNSVFLFWSKSQKHFQP